MMTATSAAASSLPPVRTSYHVPLSLMASISEETISLWLKLGALEKLEQAVLDGYGDQLCGKTSRIPQVNKFLRQVPLFQSKIKEIHKAVSQGRLRDVQHLIDRKKLAFCRDQSGATPLHKAVIFGHQDIIEYLVARYGGVIHVRDHQGRSPLHYAAFLPDGGEIYQFLLVSGADERAMDVYGRQPSHYVDGQNENTLRQLREGTGINGLKRLKPRYYNQSPGNKAQENGTKLVVSKMQVRELIADGNLEPLEDLVLQGHGDRLLGETSKDPRVQTFLNIVPMYMERIYDVHRAVMRDQLEHVVILLENRRLAMARDQLGATPLHKAVWFGHYKIAHFISHHFPETLNTLDLEGRTPLHYAAALRDNKHMYGIIAEADANKSIFDNKGKTADYYLQYPEHLNLDDVIKRCHKVNANYLANTANRIKGKSPTRQTPPPSNGSSSSPRSDDNNGSSKESGISGENGTEPEQMLAMLQKDTLAKRVDICSANIQRWVQSRDVEKLKRAVMEGYGEKVIRIQGDGQFNEPNDDDMNLSSKMFEMVQTVNAIHTAVSNDDVSELQNQLNQRDYILAKDHMGMTPLHRAVLLGRSNVLKYLIDKFPETINVKNKEGRTALHYAAAMSRKDGQNLYKMLIQGGADSRVRDNHGRTSDYYKTHLLTLPNKTPKVRAGNGVPTRHSEPLNRYSKQGVLERMTVALQRGDVDLLQELVLEGHGRHILGKASWNEDVKQFLKDLPNYLTTIQNLHAAVKEGKVEVIKEIVSNNEKLLKARDENGSSPIHLAAQIGQSEVMSFLMFNYPSTLNYKDGLGRTAMHILCQDGNSVLYKRLKDAGADPKILDQKGRTAEFYLQNSKGEPHTYKINGNFEAPKKLMDDKHSHDQVLKTTHRSTRDKRSLEQPGNIRKHEVMKKSKPLERRKTSMTKNIGMLGDKSVFETSLKKQSTLDDELDEDKPTTQGNETYDDSFDDDTGENDEGKSEDSDHQFNETKNEVNSNESLEQETDDGNIIETRDTDDEIKSEDQEINEISVENGEIRENESTNINTFEKSDSRDSVDGGETQENESADNETTTTERSNEDVKSTELSLQTEKTDEGSAFTLESIQDSESNTTNEVNVNICDEQSVTIDTKTNVEEKGRTVAEVGSSHSNRSTPLLNIEQDDKGTEINEQSEIENKNTQSNEKENESTETIDENTVQTSETEKCENNEMNESENIGIEKSESAENENNTDDKDENIEKDSEKVDDTENKSDEANGEKIAEVVEDKDLLENEIKSEENQEATNVNAEEAQGTTSEEAQNLTAEETQDTMDEEVQDTKAEAEQDTTAEEAQDTTAEEAQDTTAKEAQDTTAEEAQDTTAEEAQDTTAEEAQDTTAEEAQDTTAEEAQDTTAEEAQDTTGEEAQDATAEEAQDATAEEAQDSRVEEAQHIKAEEAHDTEIAKDKSDNDNNAPVEKDVSEKASENAEIKESKSEEQETNENEDMPPDEKKEENLEKETNNEAKADEEKITEDLNDKSGNDEENANNKIVTADSDQPKHDSETSDNHQKESENTNSDQPNNEDKPTDKENEPQAPESKNEEPGSSEVNRQDGDEGNIKANENIEEQTHQTKDHLDELIEHWIKEGDLLRLEHVVLAGQGDRLIERTSEDKQVQDFLDLVPIYMAKIRAVHEAVVKGQLRDVRSILTRKRFALSRDHVGASPLHLAVLHGHSDVATYVISHFPETMDGPDNEGRTPLHYASALPDNGALYKILKVAGADENIEDKSGHSPKYYFNRHGDLTLSELLEPYMASE